MLSDPYMRPYFGGVLGRDQLPVFVHDTPKLYIVNTDLLAEPGTHWIVLYMDEDGEIFNSLGIEPEEDFKNFLIVNSIQYKYNCKRLQNYNSNACGLYCLFYAYCKCRGYDFQEFLNLFTDDFALNDVKVKYFYDLTK